MIIQSKGDLIIIRGVLVENHWPALKSVVSLLLKRHPAGVIIDGSELTEVSDLGAQTFLDASEYIESQNARVMVAGLSDEIAQAIGMVPGIRSQLPRAATVEEARASLAVSGAETIPGGQRSPVVLVPLIGDWHRSLDYAVAEASKLKADIHVLYVIEVPRAQALGVPLPEKEKEAERVLAKAEALLKVRGVAARKLSTRARQPIDGVAKFAAESNPRLLIVAYWKSEFELISRQQDISGTMCREVECEVAVICSAEPEEETPQGGRGSVRATEPTIVFPLIGSWQRAVDFVGMQASAMKLDVELLYVIPVPRTMSLEASIPDKEEEAARLFDEAERGLKRHRVPVRKVLMRSREVIEGIVRHASASRPTSVVISYERLELDQEYTRDEAVGTLCRDVPADVVTICPKE